MDDADGASGRLRRPPPSRGGARGRTGVASGGAATSGKRRDEGESDSSVGAERLKQDSKSESRRDVPAHGSAAEIKRLREDQSLQTLVERINCDAMAAEILRKRKLLYIAMSVAGLAMLVFIIASIMRWSQVAYITKFSLLAFPICVAFGVNDLCLHISRSNPVLGRRILRFLSFGNANSLRTLAWLHIDSGDYAKAEKIVGGAVAGIDPKRKLRDYVIMHAFLANLRAHVGRMVEAEKLIREVLNAAESHDKELGTDGSAFLLADTLNYAASLCDQRDKIQDALALARRSVSLLCAHKSPPPAVTLTALSNAGYLCNIVGEYQEAMMYLSKANELSSKTMIARDGQAAFILSNLAIANLGVGRVTKCKRFLHEAETRAMMPLGLSERPHTYQCFAIYHFANSRLEEALQAYEKAIEYCGQQIPRDSVLLLRIIKEYSVLLRELGKPRQAKENEQRVTQIQTTLDTINTQLPTKKDKKKKPIVAVPVRKSRFPIFCIGLVGLWGFNLWNAGLRMGDFTDWLLFLSGCVVVVVKLCAKYGPPAKEETSQGAIVAVVSLIPGLRMIVPELSVLPRKTAGIVMGSAAAILILARVTAPTPDTVPAVGLLGQEYLVLGDNLVRTESFNKARESYEHSLQLGFDGSGRFAKVKIDRDLPRFKQPDKAIALNMKAVELSKTDQKSLEVIEKDRKAAKKIWQQCVIDYPKFEIPYVHLADGLLSTGAVDKKKLISHLKDKKAAGDRIVGFERTKAKRDSAAGEENAAATSSPEESSDEVADSKSAIQAADNESTAGASGSEVAVKTDDESLMGLPELSGSAKANVQKAEALLQKALSINPNCGEALERMLQVESQLGKRKKGEAYLEHLVSISGDTMEGGLYKSLLAIEKNTDEIVATHKKAASTKAK